jgi:hypothetical protein
MLELLDKADGLFDDMARLLWFLDHSGGHSDCASPTGLRQAASDD